MNFIQLQYLFYILIFFLIPIFSKKAEIHPNGFWCGLEAKQQHRFDANLADALLNFFLQEKATSIVDFGCGEGKYIQTFSNHNFYCEAYDGNPQTPILSNQIGKVLDLSIPMDLNRQFDWVLSLEVGEHIPKEFETIFIENLIRHSSVGIILSWAVKGQGGYGHFNEQDNEYIKKKMASYGLINDLEAEKEIRNESTLRWFKNTIMVFRKKFQ
jgi:hypothetical protein